MSVKRKKKNPADATMRNVRAGKKRVTTLRDEVTALRLLCMSQAKEIDSLFKRVSKLESNR